MAIYPFPNIYLDLQAQPPLDERVGLFLPFKHNVTYRDEFAPVGKIS